MMQSGLMDETKVKRGLLTLFLVMASVFLAWFGLKRGMPLIGLTIPAVAVVSGLLGRPGALLMTALFVQNAQIKIPGLPSVLGAFELFQGLLVGWAILDVTLRTRKRPNSYRAGMDVWLLLFLLNLFLIISVRGFGLRFSGGTTWGGTEYVAIILTILFFFSADRLRLSEKQIRTLLWAMLGGAVLMASVEQLITLFPGQFYWLNSFFRTGAEKALKEGFSEDGIQRFFGTRKLTISLIPLAFVFCKNLRLRMFWFLASIALIAMSGFRSATFSAGMIVFFLSLYDAKSRVRMVLFWVFLGLLGLGFLMVAAPYLPRAIQRAVSFLEFIPVDPDIAGRAGGSSNWRFDMWRDYCIPNVPKYLLVGRGLAREISGFAWLQGSWYTTGEFYYQMGRYHSGPFSLLLDFGLLGTMSFTLFFLLAVREGWVTLRRFRTTCEGTIAFRFYVYLTITLSYRLVSFYLIFGDVVSSLMQLLGFVVLMRILRKNFLEEATFADVSSFAKASASKDLRRDKTAEMAPPDTRNQISEVRRRDTK